MHYSKARALVDDATRCFAASREELEEAREAIWSIDHNGWPFGPDERRIDRIRYALSKLPPKAGGLTDV